MALMGRRDGRNFGYGRQLSYAGPQALRDLFGGGHYGTVKAHSDRWLAFVRWCRSEDGPRFNDARQIDRQTLADYAMYLRGLIERGDLAIATAQNRLSSVNRTMAALRGDQYVKVPSPSRALGMQRTSVRVSAPHGQDREQVVRIVEEVQKRHPRAAAIVHLVRASDMRLRETVAGSAARRWDLKVREAARSNKGMQFMAFPHHITPQLLAQSFYALRRDAAVGVDGMSWREYEEGLLRRLTALHGRLHSGAYGATPSRRVYIPKADGSRVRWALSLWRTRSYSRRLLPFRMRSMKKTSWGSRTGFDRDAASMMRWMR